MESKPFVYFCSGEVYYLLKGSAVKSNTSENGHLPPYFLGPPWKIYSMISLDLREQAALFCGWSHHVRFENMAVVLNISVVYESQ